MWFPYHFLIIFLSFSYHFLIIFLSFLLFFGILLCICYLCYFLLILSSFSCYFLSIFVVFVNVIYICKFMSTYLVAFYWFLVVMWDFMSKIIVVYWLFFNCQSLLYRPSFLCMYCTTYAVKYITKHIFMLLSRVDCLLFTKLCN